MALIGFRADSAGVLGGCGSVIFAVQYNGLPYVYVMSDTGTALFTSFETFLPVTIHNDSILSSLNTSFVEFSMIGGLNWGKGKQRMVLKVKGNRGSNYIYEEDITVEGDGLVTCDVEVTGYPDVVKKAGGKKKIPWSAEYWDGLLLSPDCRFRKADPCRPVRR
jgi:hypothetical protein